MKHLPCPTAASLALLLAATACERDIDIDYHEAEPVHVVEAHISQTGTSVRLTTTQPMNNNDIASHAIGDATVVISAGDSIRLTLNHTASGYYTAPLRGVPGTTYQIDVTIGQRHYTSTSTMQAMPQMNSFRFVWKKMMGRRLLFADLRLQDAPNAQNHYFMHLYRNGIGYRWAVMRDTQSPGGELQQLFTCTMEDSDDDDRLVDGDTMRLEVRAIDRRAYDYLYSMQQQGSTGTNPIANFSGGCLGYFSAYSQLTHTCTFYLDEVEEET